MAGTNARVGPHGYLELQLNLKTAGMSATGVILYTHMLWRSGKDLDWPIYAKMLAIETCMLRPVVSRLLKLFIEMGAAEPVDPKARPTLWKFPTYQELIRRVRDWSSNKLKQKGLV